ncbi:Mariner Mos1 transposase [Eumeta japonica]|uniref:Mariner Mos1 transposase n=1 Tax=Eumeta variegata TaxID=151549 RepID=A0A4C1WUN0_EUMVA|nr:Mariner Mos1 transposase [Eumeta japonica]
MLLKVSQRHIQYTYEGGGIPGTPMGKPPGAPGVDKVPGSPILPGPGIFDNCNGAEVGGIPGGNIAKPPSSIALGINCNKKNMMDNAISFVMAYNMLGTLNLRLRLIECSQIPMVRPLLVKERAKWFQRFKNSDFDFEAQHGGGREKVFEDAELEALLDQDSCQMQQELAGLLGLMQQAISKRLKVMGMIQKQGHWVPYELKP